MLLTFDYPILNFLQAHMTSPIMDKVMLFITSLGNLGIIWIVFALIFLVFKKHRKMGAAMLIALLIAVLLGDAIMKPLIHRIRPFVNGTPVNLLITPVDYSFPSGHAFSSFAAAIAIWCYKRNWGIWAAILAALISFSRLYLYVHYPSDVIAGMILGIGAGIASYYIVESLRQKKFSRQFNLVTKL